MECPHIPELNYSEFSKRLHDKVANQRIPITGSLEVTARWQSALRPLLYQPACERPASAETRAKRGSS